jgi:hypothetical protein
MNRNIGHKGHIRKTISEKFQNFLSRGSGAVEFSILGDGVWVGRKYFRKKLSENYDNLGDIWSL